MKGPTIIERPCDACGAPAVYTERRGSDDDRPTGDLCDGCARWRGAMRHGEACVALKAIGFGIAIARNNGLTDNQIREAVQLILAVSEEGIEAEGGSYPIGGEQVLGRERREDRPWMRTFRPLARVIGTSRGLCTAAPAHSDTRTDQAKADLR